MATLLPLYLFSFRILTVPAPAARDRVGFRSPAELRGTLGLSYQGSPQRWRGGVPGFGGDLDTFSGARRWAWDLEEGLREAGCGRARCSPSCLSGAARGDAQVCRPGVRSPAPRLAGGVCAPACGGRRSCGALRARSE